MPKPKTLLQRLRAVKQRLRKSQSDPTNTERGLWGELAITAFAAQTGQDEDVATDPETVLGDLLADLMHFCDGRTVDFEEALRRGRDHHQEEWQEAQERGADCGGCDLDCERCGQHQSDNKSLSKHYDWHNDEDDKFKERLREPGDPLGPACGHKQSEDCLICSLCGKVPREPK